MSQIGNEGVYRKYSTAPLFKRTTKLDTFYFVYFILHIVITILIDSSLVIPKEYQPGFQRAIIDFHTSQNKDFLLVDIPDFLYWFGWIEIVFQLPLFFVGSIALWKRNTRIYVWLVVYGLEASITTLTCILKIYEHGALLYGLTDSEVWNLISVYLPTFLIPFFLALDLMTRDWSQKKIKTL